MAHIQVLLADDHTLFRRGIRTLLEHIHDIAVVGEAATGEEAIALARDLVPDVILMDIGMPGINGIEATRAILSENPHVGIILVTMFDDPESVLAGMRAGAKGYVLKEADPEELKRAVEAAYRGEALLGPIIVGKVLEHVGEEPAAKEPELPYAALTPRELQVLQLAAEGRSNKEIAGKLVSSEKTAKNHVANIFSKLQVNDRTQAVLYAIQKGIVRMGDPRN